MKFTKMHGIGNDYVYVNCFEECVEDPGRLARLVSDRHLGIGGDGLVRLKLGIGHIDLRIKSHGSSLCLPRMRQSNTY